MLLQQVNPKLDKEFQGSALEITLQRIKWKKQNYRSLLQCDKLFSFLFYSLREFFELYRLHKADYNNRDINTEESQSPERRPNDVCRIRRV